MKYTIRAADTSDLEAIAPLLPRLADFELPKERRPEDLWEGDERLLQAWAGGRNNKVKVFVAVTDKRLVGVAAIQFRPELLSHEPSAHLELLAVSKDCEGAGIGKALVAACENAASEGGALSITLHVFSSNRRARRVYERAGYFGELIRYTKPLLGDDERS